MSEEPKRLQGTRARRGYTVVEVAMAMTLFGIGASAVVAMERTSVQGDMDARKQDIATYVASEWIDRLRRDAILWNLPSPANPTATDNRLTSATSAPPPQYLYATAACNALAGADGGAATPLTFTLPPVAASANVDGLSYAFDMFGHDLAVTSGAPTNTMFCAQISECIEATDTTGVATLIQATVRVIWPRHLNNDTPAGVPSNWCGTNTALPDVTNGADTFRTVSETTLIQKTSS